MTVSRLMIFDDGRGMFGPLTDLRTAFELRTGAATTLRRIERILGQHTEVLIVPDPMASIVGARHRQLSVNVSPPVSASWHMVNGRCASAKVLEQVAKLPVGHAILQEDRTLIGAHVQLGDDWELPRQIQVTTLTGRVLLERPWHIHDELRDNLMSDLLACSPEKRLVELPKGLLGVTIFGEHPVRIHPTATVSPACVLCSEEGPVVIGRGARIEPTAVLQGPCYIGSNAHVAAGCYIRPDTVIGPMCKVGGEISASILAGFSNKAHAGYLGNSLVGYWVNLGADTTVSNLKNTYGPVRMQLEFSHAREDTGRITLGPLIGDYVRTAIGTRLLTGSVIGTACMLAVSGFAPVFADRFGFYTEAGRAPYDVEKLMQTARTMMQRRGCELLDSEAKRLLDLTAGVRGRVGASGVGSQSFV